MKERSLSVKTPDDWSEADTKIVVFVMEATEQLFRQMLNAVERTLPPGSLTDTWKDQAADAWFQWVKDLAEKQLDAKTTVLKGP